MNVSRNFVVTSPLYKSVILLVGIFIMSRYNAHNGSNTLINLLEKYMNSAKVHEQM